MKFAENGICFTLWNLAKTLHSKYESGFQDAMKEDNIHKDNQESSCADSEECVCGMEKSCVAWRGRRKQADAQRVRSREEVT